MSTIGIELDIYDILGISAVFYLAGPASDALFDVVSCATHHTLDSNCLPEINTGDETFRFTGMQARIADQ